MRILWTDMQARALLYIRRNLNLTLIEILEFLRDLVH